MLAHWRRSVQSASAVGAGDVVAVAQTVSKRQLRKQRRRTMREDAMRWVRVKQNVARCNVHKWGNRCNKRGSVV